MNKSARDNLDWLWFFEHQNKDRERNLYLWKIEFSFFLLFYFKHIKHENMQIIMNLRSNQ